MSRVELQPACILHTRAYRNTSLLLEALTRDHGRIGLVARGVRGANPARRARLQAFRELHLSYAGRGELKTLREVEELSPPPALRGESLACAWYLNELLLKLIPRDEPQEGVYDIYLQALRELGAGGEPDRPLRLFELRLLRSLGYGLVLDRDQQGAPLEPQRYYDYQPDAGPGPALGLAAAAGTSRIRGQCLLALQAEELAPECRRPVRQLLQSALQAQLGTQTLHSRSFLMELRRLREQPAHD